jgi:hypothetical protein
LGATPTPSMTPLRELPNTGPDSAFALAIGGPLLGLIARKFWM